MAVATLLVLSSVCAAAFCNDVHVGDPNSGERPILDKTFDYKATVYVRSELVNVVADDNSVISRIEVVDRRPDKSGLANITQGGVGEKFVSIQLKGPGVFRDMTFEVKVYAIDDRLSNFATGVRQSIQNGVQRVGEYVSGQTVQGTQNRRSEPLEYGTKTGNYVYDRQAPEGTYNANYGVKA